MTEILLYITLGLVAVLTVLVILLFARVSSLGSSNDKLEKAIRDSRLETTQTVAAQLQTLSGVLSDGQTGTRTAVNEMARRNDERLDALRQSITEALTTLRNENNHQLEQMRLTVDERLQKTLESRISESFKQVTEQLQKVYEGLGEMQNLATGVGDLKKVLSNVKTRGILGEIQLGAILEQILSPEQYATNVAVKKGSRDPVEYAVKMPGGDDGPVWLPIDAKFPGDVYAQLNDAYVAGDAAAVNEIGKTLEARIKSFAKDIRDKYIAPPETTDFAIMFLPTEGLYAEVIRRGLVDTLQREYHVNIAGPTTMAALLNSLQMGFRTLALQKRSSEVWNLLGAVRTEFERYGDVVASVQKRLQLADNELNDLVGVRTRAIQRKLRDVTALPEAEAAAFFPGDNPAEE